MTRLGVRIARTNKQHFPRRLCCMGATPPTSRALHAEAQPVLNLLDGFRASQVLFVSVDLGVYDTLDKAAGLGLSAPALATSLPQPVSEDGLERLLDAATALGLLDKTPGTQEQPGLYQLNNVSRQFLTTSSPTSLRGYVVHSQRVVWPLFGGLKQAVGQGSHVFQEVMGYSPRELFDNLYNTPQGVLQFMQGMHSFSALSARAVLTAFDLSKYRRWVDLGGATGALMTTGAELYPDSTMTVVDLPAVVEAAQQHFTQPPYVTDTSLLSRVTWQAGDFFGSTDQLPPADLVCLSRILHDWPDHKCTQVLQTAFQMLPSGGAVLLAEMLLDSDKAGPAIATLQSLNMLVQTEGRERTPTEYQKLLESVGFVDVRWQKTGWYLDAVLAVKP